MKKNYCLLFLFSFCLLNAQVLAQAPDITGLVPASTEIEQYGKFEAVVQLSAGYSNPYDYDDIRVGGIFTGPDGQSVEVDGFFMQDYEFTNLQTGAITPLGNGVFKIRFSPPLTGVWTYSVTCTNAAGSDQSTLQQFNCVASGNTENKGFVQSGATNYLEFPNGDPFIPVGENICWPTSNAYVDYSNWLEKLRSHQGNFFRLWHCHWGLGIEWKNDGTYAGLRRYQQRNAFYQDWLFDYCADNGVYLMLCLQHHGQVSTLVNPNWSDSPYNADNGGPCNNTWDFFTSSSAKNHVKNRLRYVLARWGYARSIAAWELFNEVEWTDQFELHQDDIVVWHEEMAAYLKNHDPYQHLVSTSFANDNLDPAIWNQSDMDVTQTHYYVNTPNLERVLAQGERSYLAYYGKPTLNAEFGLSPAGNDLVALDPDGIHIHNCLWGSLFGGGLGSGMSWWWDSYLDPQNLYTYFEGIGELAQQIPFSAEALQPEPNAVSGAPGNLTLGTSVGWGELADTSFSIDAGGNVSPAGAALGYFLYGSQWNTQYRRPPAFYVNYPQNGTFEIKTGSFTGTNPQLAVWLDGQKIFEQNAGIDQVYAVNIPAGQHQIRVDNTGTDWITISYYSFSELGSAVDAYTLVSAGRNRVAGWALNNRYNHDYLAANGAAPAAGNATVRLDNLQNGDYDVRFYDCLSAALLSVQGANVSNGVLDIPLPEFWWDIAFEAVQTSVRTEVPVRATAFELFPNPLSGRELHLTFTLENTCNVRIDLLDAAGRSLQALYRQKTAAGEQILRISLPDGLPDGVYWLKMDTGATASARPLVLLRP